jgi:hypothetical protein
MLDRYHRHGRKRLQRLDGRPISEFVAHAGERR